MITWKTYVYLDNLCLPGKLYDLLENFWITYVHLENLCSPG